MKAKITLLLALLIMLFSFGFAVTTVYAQANSEAQGIDLSQSLITIDTLSKIKTGSIEQISVNIQDSADAAAIQFVLLYDSTKLELTDVSSGDLLSNNIAPTINTRETGKMVFVWDSLAPLSGSGSLLDLTFKVKEGASGKAEVWINENDDFVFANSDYEAVPIKMVPGGVEIISNDVTPPNTIEVQEIILNRSSIMLAIGDKEMLVAVIKPTNAANNKIYWISSNQSVVMVEDGRIYGKVSGRAAVIAQTEDGGCKAFCQVTVTENGEITANLNSEAAPLISASINTAGLKLNYQTATLKQDETLRLQVILPPELPSDTELIWFSSNETVATIEDSIITAKQAGTTTITVMTEDGLYMAECTVTVNRPPAAAEPVSAVLPVEDVQDEESEPGSWVWIACAILLTGIGVGVFLLRRKSNKISKRKPR